MYKAKEANDFQNLAVSLLHHAKREPAYDGDVRLYLEVWRSTHHRYDLDNCIKAVQDCLEKADIVKNDAQVVELQAVKRYGDDEYVHLEVFKL